MDHEQSARLSFVATLAYTLHTISKCCYRSSQAKGERWSMHWLNSVVLLPLILRQGTRTLAGCECTSYLF